MNIFGKTLFTKSAGAFTASTRSTTLSLLLQGSSAQVSPMSTNAMLLLRTFSTVNKGATGMSQGALRGLSSQTATPQQAVPNEILESTADEVLSGGEPEIVSKLKKRYPGIKRNRMPKAFFSMDIDRDFVPAEEKLISTYGFLKEEVNFVMRYNPKFILFD